MTTQTNEPCLPITIERGLMEGRFFTQWRIDLLEDLLRLVIFAYGDAALVDVTQAKMWYDETTDFHKLEFTANGKSIHVRFYKVFSVKINGEDFWIGCPRSAIGNLAKHIRDAVRAT